MEYKRNRKLRRLVKKNTRTLIAAIHAVWSIHKRTSTMVMLSQPRANIEANDLKPSEQELNILKAWNEVWLGFEPLVREMQKAGWIDAARVKSTYDQIREETGIT